jgi:hypothetical protein
VSEKIFSRATPALQQTTAFVEKNTQDYLLSDALLNAKTSPMHN